MTEVSIFGMNPHVSHFLNILLFAITCMILYFFLQKLLKDEKTPLPLLATLLFVFHPIHTEVLANIKSRDEILGFLFGLSSFQLLLLGQEYKKTLYYVISLIAFFIAIFCKENCLSFAVIIPLLLYFLTSLKPKEIALKSLPYFACVSIYLLVRFQVLQGFTFSQPIPIINNTLMVATNPWEEWATRFVLLGRYIYMTIIPYPLSWDYSYHQIPVVSWTNLAAILSLLVCIVLFILMVAGFRKKSIYTFLIAFFFITLFLSSNLVIKIAWTFAERFLYVPSLAFCIAFPVLMSKIIKSDLLRYTLFVCLFGIYTWIVIPRNRVWKNNLTLYSSGVISSPNSARTHLFLAKEYGEQLNKSTDNEKKKILFDLDVKESYQALSIYGNYYEAYNNLGVLYGSWGLRDSARSMFQKVLEINPGDEETANNLGILCEEKADYQNALKYFTISLKKDSAFPAHFLNIGAVYQKMGDTDKAAYYYNQGLKINPGNEDIKTNLFSMYFNSGLDFFKAREYNSALKQFMLAKSYNPRSAEIYGYLGILFQLRQDYSVAIAYYKKSLEIDPDNRAFKNNLEALIAIQK
jgi:tetratricopeptide (TPR) repeat protein